MGGGVVSLAIGHKMRVNSHEMNLKEAMSTLYNYTVMDVGIHHTLSLPNHSIVNRL